MQARGSASAWEPCVDRQEEGEGGQGWVDGLGGGGELVRRRRRCCAAARAVEAATRLTKMALNTAVLATSHPTWLELADVAQRQSA